MTSETLITSQATEEVVLGEEAKMSRLKLVAAWLAAGGIAAAAYTGFNHFDHADAPCASTTSLDGSFTSSDKLLVLPNGSKVDFSIFSKSSDLNTKNPHARITVGDNSRMIESLDTPGPVAKFTFGDTLLYVDATNTAITTYCEPVSAAR